MKSLSVVIPSRNGRRILEDHLPPIMEETASCSGELLVVDDCSDDGTAEFLKREHPTARILRRTEHPAFCRAVNLGMEEASGEFLLLLNNDTRPVPGSFASLIERLQNTGSDTGVAVPSIPRPDGTDDSLFRWGVRRGLAVTGQNVEGRSYPSGACAMWKKEVWEALGGLDCRYAPIYWEDADMGLRMHQEGYSMLLCGDITVYHDHASTMGASLETRTLRERNRFIFMDAHGIKPGMWLPVHFAAAVLRGNTPFVRGYSAYRKWKRSR